MSNIHLTVLPASQRQVWDILQKDTFLSVLESYDLYLAGGTALALQLNHRQSHDFDFFSQQTDISAHLLETALRCFESVIVRDQDRHTLHIEVQGVKCSFIGNYQYKRIEDLNTVNKIQLASPIEIGLMKLLAITHRATVRDYIDLAVIIRDVCPLKKLLDISQEKYGKQFNTFLVLKTLVSFDELDSDMPTLIDNSIENTWQEILTSGAGKIATKN